MGSRKESWRFQSPGLVISKTSSFARTGVSLFRVTLFTWAGNWAKFSIAERLSVFVWPAEERVCYPDVEGLLCSPLSILSPSEFVSSLRRPASHECRHCHVWITLVGTAFLWSSVHLKVEFVTNIRFYSQRIRVQYKYVRQTDLKRRWRHLCVWLREFFFAFDQSNLTFNQTWKLDWIPQQSFNIIMCYSCKREVT